MSPALTETHPIVQPLFPKSDSKALSPNGTKTSGQHPPLYDKLYPLDSFPSEISGPTVWKAEDYRDNPSQWIHPFTPTELAEMSQAADNFLAAETPLTAISKVRLHLPAIASLIQH